MGGYQQRARIPERGSSRELYPIRHRQNKKARYSCQEEGCIKTFQSLAAIQKHPNKDKHSEADKKIRLWWDQEKMDEDRLAILKGVATFKVGPQVNFWRNIPN